MTNQELLQKMKEDMEMRGFSHWTKESYELKAKDVMRYFKKLDCQHFFGSSANNVINIAEEPILF